MRNLSLEFYMLSGLGTPARAAEVRPATTVVFSADSVPCAMQRPVEQRVLPVKGTRFNALSQGSKIENAGGLHFQFNEGQRAVVEDDPLDRQPQLAEGEQIHRLRTKRSLGGQDD
jgi:hypothetical protein